MSTKVQRVLDQALAMTPSEKAQIAHSLIVSLDFAPDTEVESEWLALASQRAAALDGGKVEPISWDELKRRIREG